jgi:hypothetical protein
MAEVAIGVSSIVIMQYMRSLKSSAILTMGMTKEAVCGLMGA